LIPLGPQADAATTADRSWANADAAKSIITRALLIVFLLIGLGSSRRIYLR
jgi:hypothetical protein